MNGTRVACPYGQKGYSHDRAVPYDFPCSGIQPGRDHVIDLIDWLTWLTEKIVELEVAE